MIWIILIITVVAIYFGAKNQQNIENNNKKYGILYRDYNGEYLGGFPDLEGGKKVNVTITQKGVVVEFKNKIKSVKKEDIVKEIQSNERFIRKENIINAEIQSEQKINNNINLGKLIVFGWLALGMKEKNKIVNYLVITHKDNGETRNIILKIENLEQATKIIRNDLLNLNNQYQAL